MVSLDGINEADPLIFDYGFASSRYFDSFTFNDPNLNGQHGFFDATLHVHGSGETTLSESFLNAEGLEFEAFWQAVINVSVDGVEGPNGPVQSVYYAREWYKDPFETTLEYCGDPLNTYQQIATFEFIYCEPILMDSFLQVLTQVDNQYSEAGGTLHSRIDLSNSAYWGGIRNLREASGNPVSDSGYSSSSGFDYRLSTVPEPSSVAVLSLGVLMALRRRTRRSLP